MAALALIASSTPAHFPLVNAASGGPTFYSLATAVEVGDIDRSQATNRVAFCNYPYFWFKFDAPSGFETLMVGSTVPVIERFFDTRVAVVVIGPGLSTDFTGIPQAIVDQIPAGMGATAVPAVDDVSKCDWMEDPLSTGALTGTQPYISSRGGDEAPFTAYEHWAGDRCFYHEEWGGSDMWIVQDKLVDLASTGTHYMVYWSPGDKHLGEPTMSAKFGVVFGDVGQSEEFSGEATDAGECSLPAEDFYENACRMEVHDAPSYSAACKPFYGVPVPNLYECTEPSAAADHCNSLCHNEGHCLPADAVTCPGECAETCSMAACPGTQGPLGPACPLECSADHATHAHRRRRKLLFGSVPHGLDHCPPECLGDFHHDHGAEEEDGAAAGTDADGERPPECDGSASAPMWCSFVRK